MKNPKASFCVLAVAGFTIVCARAEDWQCYQHDASHTGYSSAFVNASALTLKWSAPTGYATPLIVGKAVYATKNQGGMGGSSTSISSFNITNGAVNWTYTGNFVFPSQAAVGGGFVVFWGGLSSDQMYVLDANTGALRYTVPGVGTGIMSTIVTNSVTGAVTAYVATTTTLKRVSLGVTSASVLWTAFGSFGGSSMPTVVGSSIVMAGPGHYSAFDQQTGAANHFHVGGVSGGGGTAVAYDAARRQFYVLEQYETNFEALTAYHYTSNSQIEMLWQKTGAGIRIGGSVAIGPTGNVYAADFSRIVEIDPTTGATLRTIPGSFAGAMTPAITGNTLWAFGQSQTFAYDLLTLELLRALPGSRGSLNSDYDGPGAFADGYFALDYGVIFDRPGFDVYEAPFPVRLSSVVSRMSHGSAGTFDVELPPIGGLGIEDRDGGPSGDFTLIFIFANPLASVGMAGITGGSGSIITSGIDPTDSHAYIVSLTSVANAQMVTVALTNVTDVQGGTSAQLSATMGILLGDTNGDGFVNSGDGMQTRSQSGQEVGSENFRADVSVDGVINSSDIALVKSSSGTSLP